MKKRKNKLDEMQEQSMLHIESKGCWIAFIGLMVVIAAQLVYYGMDSKEQILGETIVFLCMGFYIVTACVKNGVWDRKFEPGFKVNLCASLIAAVVSGALKLAMVYRENMTGEEAVGSEAAAAAAFMLAVNTFILCLVVLSIMLLLYRWRKNKLENTLPDGREDE